LSAKGAPPPGKSKPALKKLKRIGVGLGYDEVYTQAEMNDSVTLNGAQFTTPARSHLHNVPAHSGCI